MDFKQIPFQRVALLPGFHLRTVRRHAPKTSVPVLLTGNETVQGSSEIIDFLDKHNPDPRLTPVDTKDQLYCAQLEQEWGEKFGEPIRTILYDRLLDYPDYIRFCFTHTLSPSKRFIFRLYYPFLRKLMHQVYVKSDQYVDEAKAVFKDSLAEIEQKIDTDGYLLSGRFTRADLSLCSMLSLLVLPPEFPLSWPEMPDHEIRTLHDDYKDHPVCDWVRHIYRTHRHSSQ